MSQAPAAQHDLSGRPLLLCFSHLRWDFVTQRPQHLLTRAARSHRVVYWEEAVPDEGVPRLELLDGGGGVTRVVPRLPAGLDEAASDAAQRRLLDGFLAALPGGGRPAVAWFYTPMAVGFAGHLDAEVTVYDCMDELAAFDFASPRLLLLERHLFRRADLVFTGGRSLYESKRGRHPSVHCFPSSIDAAHFARARQARVAPVGATPIGATPIRATPIRAASAPALPGLDEPADQAAIPHPRIGWFGVVDERMDAELLGAVAALRPDWQFVMIGPVVKIDPASLPRPANVHWLGGRGYDALPAYLGGWDAGLMPFAMNAATRFISPTKTPEYLAAGVPVVSTPIADVVRPWGEDGLVEIAADAPAAVAALERVLGPGGRSAAWLARVDLKLARLSWDRSWGGMLGLIREVAAAKAVPRGAGTLGAGPMGAGSLGVGPLGVGPLGAGGAVGEASHV